ncbi:MAG: outer membrane protein assembly factor BamB family protein [Planctomycetota bacterium]|jgi:outer membrane protein assembly factor BamB
MKRFTLILAVMLITSDSAFAESASDIIRRSGVRGGLIVHLGCGDSRLTADLLVSDSYLVHGLDTEAQNVEKGREHITSLNLYGQVSIDRFDGKRLPYVDNLVNLVIAEDISDTSIDEVMRVLAPNGVAYIKKDGGWQKTVKPRPKEIDEWTHYLYDASGNAVSLDQVVGPPRLMQWVCGPKYARSHEINSSMAAMVSAGGRLFYIWDDGPTGLTDPRFPAKWSLLARDAFNGMLLWKRPMPNWGWRQWHYPSRWDDKRERAKMLRYLPSTLPRRLVATHDRLYVTLGYEAPVSVLDVATGDVLREIEQTALTDEILLADRLLLLRVRTADHRPDRDVWDKMPSRQWGRVMAVDAGSGRVLWQSEPETMAPLTLATCGNRVFYSNYDQVVCLDRASGREIWRGTRVESKDGRRGTGGTLVAQDKVVLHANLPSSGGSNLGELRAYSAQTGKLLWTGPRYAGPGVANPPDLFVANGLVWLGETRLPVDNMETEMQRQGYDPVTGEVVRNISVPKLTSPGHHYRCYRSKATQRYLMLPKRGIEFLDLIDKNHMRNDWLRAPCIYGALPSNGMLYVAPHQCVCYQGVLMSNFNALKARTGPDTEPLAQEERLQRGPAWGEVKQVHPPSDTDWPMYRQNPRRSGSVATKVPDKLERLWEVALGKNITPPIVAGSRLLVAEMDAHTVHALDAKTGRPLWRYTAGGRVDSSPTVYGSLVLFGSADGRIYCLRAADGAEVWRFMAAPRVRRITAFGQVESAWPVHGSVVVQNDVTSGPPRPLVYFTAGRSSYLDGGIYAYALDPQTGELIHQTCLNGPHPDPYKDTGGAGYMDGAKSDILVSDGADLFLFQERFGGDLTRFPAPMQELGKERGGFRVFPPAPERGSSAKRLISTRGLLDDSYNEGTYWTFSERWPGWDRHMRGVPAYGQILSFDENRLYGVHVFTESVRVRRGFFPGTKGYRLYARDHSAKDDRWSVLIPVRVRAMVAAGEKLFVAGPPDVVPDEDPLAAFEGRRGALLWAFSGEDGEKLADVAELDALPVYDGLIATAGRLYVSLKHGRVVCFGEQDIK